MKHRGLAQIPLMIGLLLMAIAVPVATKLVQTNQENRGQAKVCECTTGECEGGYHCSSSCGTCVKDSTKPPATTKPVATGSYCNVSLISTSACGSGGCAANQVQETWKTVSCVTSTRCVDSTYCSTSVCSSGQSQCSGNTSVACLGGQYNGVKENCSSGCDTSTGKCKSSPPLNDCTKTEWYRAAGCPCGYDKMCTSENCNGNICNINPRPTATPTPNPAIGANCVWWGNRMTHGQIQCFQVGEGILTGSAKIRCADGVASKIGSYNLPNCATEDDQRGCLDGEICRSLCLLGETTSSVSCTFGSESGKCCHPAGWISPTPIPTITPIPTKVVSPTPAPKITPIPGGCKCVLGYYLETVAGGCGSDWKKPCTETLTPTLKPTSITPKPTTKPPIDPTTRPTVRPTAPPITGCNECPSTFACYKNGDENKWFADGMPMVGFTKVLNSDCGRVVTMPTFKGKTKGDANCDGYIDVVDYSLWHKEFFDGDKGAVVKSTWNADFTGSDGKCDGRVDTYDFSLWQKYFNELKN